MEWGAIAFSESQVSFSNKNNTGQMVKQRDKQVLEKVGVLSKFRDKFM